MLATKAQTSLAFTRLHVTFAFSDELPFAMKIHRHTSLTLARKMVIFKSAPSKSQQTAGQAEETGQNLFERCIYVMLLLREKRVVLSPMLETNSCLRQITAGRGMSLATREQKAVMTDFAGAGRFATFARRK